MAVATVQSQARPAGIAELLGGLALIGVTLLAAQRSEAIDLHRFPICWAGVLLALDGAGRLRHGASALPDARAWAFAAAGSLAFWDVFELLNLRLQNWWYVGVPAGLLEASAFSAVSFATVLPAVRLGEALFRSRAEGPLPQARATPARSPLRLLLTGLFALAAALAFPDVGFALAWLFLWPMAEALLLVLPRADGAAPSPLESWAAGDRARIGRLMALGLLLGLVWESLNWGCQRGWVYTVPFFEGGKLFEMPLPGYLGYLPFALECAACLALLDRLQRLWSGRAALAALGALLAVHVAMEATAFPRSTLSTSPLAAPSDGADRRALARVAHMGSAWAGSVESCGGRDVRALAGLDAETLHRCLQANGTAPPPAVVRLWVRAAQRELR